MTSTGGGLWQRFVRRLTNDDAADDSADLTSKVDNIGAQRACDCQAGEEVTVVGRLRSVELCPRDAVATLEAELYDGTDEVTLVWMGRRKIAGIEPGRTIKARGRISERDGRKVLYNPYYELQTTA